VISEIPTLAEVAGGGALAVPARDVTGWFATLSAVLSDAALAGPLAEAGRAVAARASWDHGAAALAGLLSSVASGRLGASAGMVT
jgi:hypothetical protein